MFITLFMSFYEYHVNMAKFFRYIVGQIDEIKANNKSGEMNLNLKDILCDAIQFHD